MEKFFYNFISFFGGICLVAFIVEFPISIYQETEFSLSGRSIGFYLLFSSIHQEELNLMNQRAIHNSLLPKSVISRMENHAEDIKLSTLTKYAKALGKKVKLEIQ